MSVAGIMISNFSSRYMRNQPLFKGKIVKSRLNSTSSCRTQSRNYHVRFSCLKSGIITCIQSLCGKLRWSNGKAGLDSGLDFGLDFGLDSELTFIDF